MPVKFIAFSCEEAVESDMKSLLADYCQQVYIFVMSRDDDAKTPYWGGVGGGKAGGLWKGRKFVACEVELLVVHARESNEKGFLFLAASPLVFPSR